MGSYDHPELQASATKLIKRDRWRSRLTRVFGDVQLDPRITAASASSSQGTAIAQLATEFAIGFADKASERFCDTAAELINATKLPPSEHISPDRLTGGHSRDPLLEFPSGLILRSVAAANYVLDHTPTTASEDPRRPY
jgi:hypothetical protein